MKVVIIGTGNVAVVLSKKIKAAGHVLLQVYGRNHIAASLLAHTCGAGTCGSWSAIDKSADIYLVALADRALLNGSVQLEPVSQLVLHTAGSVSMNVLQPFSSLHGVLYPLQSLRKEVEPLGEIPFLIEGSNTTALERTKEFALSLSGQVAVATERERMQYHIAAVVANNFSNYLFSLAEQYCLDNGLNFRLLLPLLHETTARLQRFSPSALQTGPAARNDRQTIEQHLALLRDAPILEQLYATLTEAIITSHRKA